MKKEEPREGNPGIGVTTVDPSDDTIPATKGNGAAAASCPIDADNGSSCSSRSTDAPSSRASERGGKFLTGDSSTAAEPAQDDAVVTPRTLKVDACLSSSPM